MVLYYWIVGFAIFFILGSEYFINYAIIFIREFSGVSVLVIGYVMMSGLNDVLIVSLSLFFRGILSMNFVVCCGICYWWMGMWVYGM